MAQTINFSTASFNYPIPTLSTTPSISIGATQQISTSLPTDKLNYQPGQTGSNSFSADLEER